MEKQTDQLEKEQKRDISEIFLSITMVVLFIIIVLTLMLLFKRVYGGG